MTNCSYLRCQFPNCPGDKIRSCGYNTGYLLKQVIKERNEMISALKPFISSAINRLNTALDIADELKEEK